MVNKGRDRTLEGEVWVRALFSKPRPAFIPPAKPKTEPLSKPRTIGRAGELWITRLFEGHPSAVTSADKMLILKNGVVVHEAVLDDLKPETVIGRHPNADIQLEAYKLGMFHACILKSDGRYYVEGLDTENGTLINRKKLSPKRPVQLRDGYLVDIPGYRLQFSIASAPHGEENENLDAEELADIPSFFYMPASAPPPACPLLSNLVEDRDKVAMWAEGITMLKVADIIDETDDVKTYRFVGEKPLLFSYKPGQFVTFLLDIDGEKVQRSYSMSSSPSRPHTLETTIKRVPGGRVSNWFSDHVKLGDVLRIKGPSGKFTCFNYPSNKMLLIGAGSGITPVMSMCRWIVDTTADVDVKLLASCRSPSDVIFRKELELVSARHSRFQVAVSVTSGWRGTESWTGFTGRISKQMIEIFAPDYKERHIFMCGPEPFSEGVKELLRHMDFDISQLHTESFGSGRVVQGITKEAGSLKLSGPLHKVTFTKSGLTVDTDENITLLELAEANGVEIAYSCRSGSCGECEAKCQGNVGIRGECLIDEKAKAAGFVYTCSTVAKADLALEA